MEEKDAREEVTAESGWSDEGPTEPAEELNNESRQSDALERLKNLHPLLKIMKASHDVSLRARLESEESLIRFREQQDAMCKMAAPLLVVKYAESEIVNQKVLVVTPESETHPDSVVLYCHGGGYNCGGLGYASVLAGKLAKNTGRKVVAHNYRLAPEYPYPAAINDTLSVWYELLARGYRPENIIVAGDSAGGNLALELCLSLKEIHADLPGMLLLMSPWTDMSATLPSYETYKELDPVLTWEYITYSRTIYIGKQSEADQERDSMDGPGQVDNTVDYRDPHYSPLYGDLSGFPPTLIQVGTYEILSCDSTELKKRLEAEGVPVKLHIYNGGCHVFQQLPTLRAGMAMDEIRQFTENYAEYIRKSGAED